VASSAGPRTGRFRNPACTDTHTLLLRRRSAMLSVTASGRAARASGCALSGPRTPTPAAFTDHTSPTGSAPPTRLQHRAQPRGRRPRPCEPPSHLHLIPTSPAPAHPHTPESLHDHAKFPRDRP
jgi:hypothetical protein